MFFAIPFHIPIYEFWLFWYSSVTFECNIPRNSFIHSFIHIRLYNFVFEIRSLIHILICSELNNFEFWVSAQFENANRTYTYLYLFFIVNKNKKKNLLRQQKYVLTYDLLHMQHVLMWCTLIACPQYIIKMFHGKCEATASAKEPKGQQKDSNFGFSVLLLNKIVIVAFSHCEKLLGHTDTQTNTQMSSIWSMSFYGSSSNTERMEILQENLSENKSI